MTFEDAYGRWLVSEINNRTVTKFKLKCRQYNELSFKPLERNPDEISLVISGGGASRSSVEGRDQNNGNFSVLVLCQKKHANNVQAAIAHVQQSYNATPLEMSYTTESGENCIIQTKSVFFTPIVIDAQDYPTKEHGTLKVVMMQFTITVLYGDSAIVQPNKFALSFNGNEGPFYDIKHLVSYDVASIPSYDGYLAQGDDRNVQQAIARNNSWAFTIYKINNDSLSDRLQTDFDAELGARQGSPFLEHNIVLRIGNKSIPIQTYQLTESYVDNAAVYILTLTA